MSWLPPDQWFTRRRAPVRNVEVFEARSLGVVTTLEVSGTELDDVGVDACAERLVMMHLARLWAVRPLWVMGLEDWPTHGGGWYGPDERWHGVNGRPRDVWSRV